MNNSKIRVIFESEQHMLDTVEQAQNLADEKCLDLVEVAPNVYKIMDYKKYLYNQSKQAKNNKQNKQETKEAQFNLSIGDGDMQRKIRDICKWLKQGCQVRVIVKLRGREQARPELGHNLMQRILTQVLEAGAIASIPTTKFPEGSRDITAVLKASK